MIVATDIKLEIKLDGMDAEFIYALYDVEEFIYKKKYPLQGFDDHEVKFLNSKCSNIRLFSHGGRDIFNAMRMAGLISNILNYIETNACKDLEELLALEMIDAETKSGL